MADPERIKDNKDLPSFTINVEDVPRLKWLGGYFDIRGTCALSASGSRIEILNSNPQVAVLTYSLLKRYGITANMSERSKPSKSSKRKRWDVFVNTSTDITKMAMLLKDYVIGKREQLEAVISGPTVENIKRMKYLNSTNHMLIADNQKLFLELGFECFEHQSTDPSNTVLTQSQYCDPDWLAGVIDAIGTFKVDVMHLKSKDMYKCCPLLTIEHHNKHVVEAIYSTFRNTETGCHVRFSVSEIKNRGKWTITISGYKRVKFLSHWLLDHLLVKKEQLNLINLYIHKRLAEPKHSIDELGYSTKCALDEMNKSL